MKLEIAIKSNKFKNETHKAGLNILYTAWWLKTLTAKELKSFDLTHEQYNVLRILKGKHPETMCVKDVASRMIEKSSNVPRIVDRLETKKLIIRKQCTIDGRQTTITLTPKGITTLEKATIKTDEIWEKIIAITDVDAIALNNILEQVRIKEEENI